MKAYGGSGGIAPTLLTSSLDIDELLLYLRGNNPLYPLDRRLVGPQSLSGRCGEEKNLALPGLKPGPSNPYPVAISTEISGCPL
jgi:hypothetical protein